jgi:hypothetical protein
MLFGRIIRVPKGDVWLGDPDRPRVVMDSRRRWLDCALAATVVIGLGNGGLAACVPAFAPELPDLEKSSVREEPGAKDARRWWVGGEEDGGELERPVDMIAKGTTASGLENENGEIDRLSRGEGEEGVNTRRPTSLSDKVEKSKDRTSRRMTSKKVFLLRGRGREIYISYIMIGSL